MEVVVNSPMYDDIGNVVGKQNDITVGKYDVIVLSGSTLPSNRWGRFEYYMQLYQAGLIDQIELLKQTDVADMEGVLERSGQMKQLQQQLRMQDEEIKKLKGDLQTAQRESLHDRKRVEVKNLKRNLLKLKLSRMAQKLYQSRLSDELKNAKNDLSIAAEDNPQREMNETILSINEDG